MSEPGLHVCAGCNFHPRRVRECVASLRPPTDWRPHNLTNRPRCPPSPCAAILQQLFRAAVVSDGSGALSPGVDNSSVSVSGSASGGARAVSPEPPSADAIVSVSVPVPPSPLTQVAAGVSIEPFHECARRGDNVGFAVLVAEAFSSAAGVDLPLCDECLEAVVKARTGQLRAALERRDDASAFAMMVAQRAFQGRVACSELTAPAAPSSSSSSAPAAHGDAACTCHDDGPCPAAAGKLAAAHRVLCAAADEEEAALVAEIAALQRRASRAAAAQLELQRRRDKLRSLEANLWYECRELSSGLQLSKERMYALRQREARYRRTLSYMRLLSVHSDAVFVWHRGPVVTINSARLGRVPGMAVEWPEINAALGQMAFLLASVAARLGSPARLPQGHPGAHGGSGGGGGGGTGGFAFSKYRVIPMGSYAKLVATGDERTSYELYFDNAFFATSRLNNALRAFMVCLGEVGAYAEACDRSFRLPYAIAASGDKVGDVPTAIGNKDAVWSKAMKMAATDLKWLVAWSFKQ